MRYLEVRRHTMRVKPRQHLSQAGVDLARRVGSTMGRFDRVITSTILRAYETAIAMGFAVDEENESLSRLGDGVENEVAWDVGFAVFAAVVRKDGATARFGEMLASYWRTLMEALPDGSRVLMITHGGLIEAGAVLCLPNANHTAWGGHCDYCEGARLVFDGGRFVDVEILRVK